MMSNHVHAEACDASGAGVQGRIVCAGEWGDTERILDRVTQLRATDLIILDVSHSNKKALLDAMHGASHEKLLAFSGCGKDYEFLCFLARQSCHTLWRTDRQDAEVIARALLEHSVSGYSVSYGGDLADALRRAGSPLEGRLALAIASHCCDDSWDMKAQVQEGRYRIDLALVSEEEDLPRFAIEVDDHEFHEKTKEQAQRDKSRDRTLTAVGWTVLRFTGREVWRDADSCASEVAAIQRKHLV